MLILLCTSAVCSSSRIELLLLLVKGIAFSEEVTRMKWASGQLGAAGPHLQYCSHKQPTLTKIYEYEKSPHPPPNTLMLWSMASGLRNRNILTHKATY